jgi:hypothetical protein
MALVILYCFDSDESGGKLPLLLLVHTRSKGFERVCLVQGGCKGNTGASPPFGQTTSIFGQTPQASSPFGQTTGAFGSAATPAFGQTSSSIFGGSTTGGFGGGGMQPYFRNRLL